ncbi:MAG: TatD family hydrolase [Mycoplasma sp.]
MLIIDTHIHMALEPLNERFEELIQEYKKNNIWINIVGTNLADSISSCEYSRRYENAFASIGIHPTDTYNIDLEETMNKLEELYNLNKDKVVAIGECGFDFHYEDTNKEIQEKFFRAHIELAIKLDLPLVLHIRDAHKEALELLLEYPNKKDIIIHCYTDNLEYALEYQERGYYISFPGVITFKNAHALREVVKEISISQILTETDAPWLSPEPNRGQINTALNVQYINQKIAEIKNIDIKEIEKILFNNAFNVLKLNKFKR